MVLPLFRGIVHIGCQDLLLDHCLVLDGVYHTPEGLPVFHAVRAPTAEELQSLLARIIKRLMNRMHRDVQL